MNARRHSPRVYAEAFVSVLADVPAGRRRDLRTAFVRRLARDGMLRHATRILAEIDRLLLEGEGLLRADLAVARRDDRDHVKNVERMLTDVVGQPVRAVVHEQPRLIAGFRARVDDLVVDASLAGKLARLRHRLSSV